MSALREAFRWTLALLGAASFVFACGETASSPPAAPIVVGDSAAPAPPTECATCLSSSCRREEAACAAEPECAERSACEARCAAVDGGASCVAACPAPAGSAAAAASTARTTCRESARSNCEVCGPVPRPAHRLLDDVCDGVDDFHRSDAAACSQPPPETAARASCRKCVVGSCCDSRTACERDPECLRLIDCIFCDENKASTCLASHPKAVQLYADYRTCAEMSCFEACAQEKPDPCVACWHDECGQTFADWRAHPTHERSVACRLDCEAGPTGDACRQACDEPTYSLPEWGRFSLCYEARCTDACSEPEPDSG